MDNIIHYGFGTDYLSNWGIPQALREIYQNFLDYGLYDEKIEELGGITKVAIFNNWQPDSLDFLRIGNSQKGSADAIGKHGEGLKMAFLILLREGYKSTIITPKYTVYPSLYIDKEIGECFCLRYEENKTPCGGFIINFQCDELDFRAFKENLITPDDMIFTQPQWGSIVSKPIGNIYSGHLFVTHVKNLTHAYDILPHKLPLDRDRSVPHSFDVNYATSRIKESYGKFTAADLTHSDSAYINSIPEAVKKEFKPIKVGNSIEFRYKDQEGNDKILSNTYVKESLHKDSFFQKAINKLKNIIAKQLGLYDLLIEFESKYKNYLSVEGKKDLELILVKAGKEFKIPKTKRKILVEDDGLPF